MAHTILVSTILSGFWSFHAGWKWPRAPDELLVLDGVVYLIHVDIERSKVGLISMDPDEVPSGLVDYFDFPARSLLRENRLCLLFLPFTP